MRMLTPAMSTENRVHPLHVGQLPRFMPPDAARKDVAEPRGRDLNFSTLIDCCSTPIQQEFIQLVPCERVFLTHPPLPLFAAGAIAGERACFG